MANNYTEQVKQIEAEIRQVKGAMVGALSLVEKLSLTDRVRKLEAQRLAIREKQIEANDPPMVINLVLAPRHYGFEMLMPNDAGDYDRPLPKDGIGMQWPVNPHDTGWRGIATMLRETEKFAGVTFSHKGSFSR